MNRRTTLLALLTAAGLAVPGLSAQAAPLAERGEQHAERAQKQAERRQLQQINVRGTVLGARTIRLQGEPQEHVLAKIRTEQGETAVIDLGPEPLLRRQQLTLRRNQQIEVMGVPGRIQGQPVVVAANVRTPDRNIVISQRMADLLQATPARGAPGPMLVQGDILSLRRAELEGEPREHVLAKVRTLAGQQVVIDLGPRQALTDLRLETGDRIAVQAIQGRINEQPVLVALQVAEVETIRQLQRRAAGTLGMLQ